MDYTLKNVFEPKRFGAEDMIGSKSIIRKIPGSLLTVFWRHILTCIFILIKLLNGEPGKNEDCH